MLTIGQVPVHVHPVVQTCLCLLSLSVVLDETNTLLLGTKSSLLLQISHHHSDVGMMVIIPVWCSWSVLLTRL